jgi:hypothetical protein
MAYFKVLSKNFLGVTPGNYERLRDSRKPTSDFIVDYLTIAYQLLSSRSVE